MLKEMKKAISQMPGMSNTRYNPQPVKTNIGIGQKTNPANLSKANSVVSKMSNRKKFPQGGVAPKGWTPATEAQIRAGTHGGASMTSAQINAAQTYSPQRPAVVKKSIGKKNVSGMGKF